MRSMKILLYVLIALLGVREVGPVAAGTVLPSEDERDILIVSTLLRFNDANVGHNYSILRELASRKFQENLSEREIAESFKIFRNKNVRLDEVAVAEIQPDEAGELLDGGILILSGHMTLSKFRVDYVLKFIHERDEWKLLFLEVNIT